MFSIFLESLERVFHVVTNVRKTALPLLNCFLYGINQMLSFTANTLPGSFPPTKSGLGKFPKNVMKVNFKIDQSHNRIPR